MSHVPPYTADCTGVGWIDGSAAGHASNRIFGWHLNGGSGNRAAKFDTAVLDRGKPTLKIETTTAGAYIEARHMATGYGTADADGFKLEPNTAYVFRFRMATELVSGDSADGAYIDVITAQGDPSGTGSTEYVSTKVKTTTGFTDYEIPFTTASNVRKGHIEFRIYGQTGAATLKLRAWLGSMSLQKVKFPNRPRLNENLVFNGDFEDQPTTVAGTNTTSRWINGSAAGSSTDNSKGWAIPASALGAQAEARFDPTVGYGGGGSMKLSTLDAAGTISVAQATNITSGNAQLEDLTQLKPNTAYTLMARVKTANVASNGCFIDVREFKEDKTSSTTNTSSKLSGTNDWTLITLNFTTGALTKRGCVILRLNVAGNVSDAWFDKIRIFQTTPEARVRVT